MSRDHIGSFNVSSGLSFARGILLLDDCEGTCNYIKSGTGADPVVDFAAAAAFIGTNGLRIQTRSTTPAQYDIASATKLISLPGSDYVLWRMMCMFPDVSLVEQVALRMYVYYLTNIWQAELRFTPNTPVMQYVNSAGAAANITALSKGVQDNQWFDIELAIDLGKLTYLSARYNGSEADLSAFALYDTGNSALSTLKLNVEIGSAGAAQATAYFDQIYCGEYQNL